MRRLLILACCLLCVLALAGCPPLPATGEIEVHIDSHCNVVFADGTSANPLNLEIRDRVKWVNDNTNRVYLDFGSTELFGRETIRLSPGHSTRTTVKSSAAGYYDDYEVDCGDEGGSGNPKVKVGDDDGGG